ncbi:PspA/IM30 family protein [Paenibacillus sp. BR2-3]|uniref:PspA/IM30 family protein n=1 Tax=Paenibacillus sp. BR2-3 TaxID=3048494 RepID=UPI00397731AC
MSILNRIATLTKAALHEGLNKLEDPVLLTGQYLRDLKEEISAAEQKERELKVAASILERRLNEYLLLADRSEDEAVKSLELGNVDEARRAVFAKLRYQENAQECTTGLEETRNTLAALEASIRSSKEEYARLKAKRAELTARAHQAAETLSSAPRSHSQGPIAGSYGKAINPGTASRGFERMEEKIAEWEVLADNLEQNFLRASYPSADPSLSKAVDTELERIRSRKLDSRN